MKPVPEAYLLAADGALNAFATRFLRSRLIVLFSDLIEACGNDAAARDMVIGHELGHHRAGHLDWTWLTALGEWIPFLGHAYSRACEYTCDRYGAAVCGDRQGALRGLAILAAGGKHGPRVNHEAMARQRRLLDSGWMTLGSWLSTHPPLCDRLVALEPALAAGVPPLRRGPFRAAAMLAVAVLVVALALTPPGARLLPQIRELAGFFVPLPSGASPGDETATPPPRIEDPAAVGSPAR